MSTDPSVTPDPPTMRGVLEEIERGGKKPPVSKKPVAPQSPRAQLIKKIAIGIAVLLMFIPLLRFFFASEPPLGPQLEGYHDAGTKTAIIGWAWDAAHPDRRVEVEISDGRTKVKVLADKFRDDLKTAGKGDGNYGFYYQIPKPQRDGVTRTVTVRFADTGKTLTNSPRKTTYEAPKRTTKVR